MTDGAIDVFPQDLVLTDHSKVYYAPFRKNFYVEIPELARLTPEGTNCHVSYYNLYLLYALTTKFRKTYPEKCLESN